MWWNTMAEEKKALASAYDFFSNMKRSLPGMSLFPWEITTAGEQDGFPGPAAQSSRSILTKSLVA